MENNLTDTELLVKINSLKTKHETLKLELDDMLVVLEQKKNELIKIEEEYMTLITKIVS